MLVTKSLDSRLHTELDIVHSFRGHGRRKQKPQDARTEENVLSSDVQGVLLNKSLTSRSCNGVCNNCFHLIYVSSISQEMPSSRYNTQVIHGNMHRIKRNFKDCEGVIKLPMVEIICAHKLSPNRTRVFKSMIRDQL